MPGLEEEVAGLDELSSIAFKLSREVELPKAF